MKLAEHPVRTASLVRALAPERLLAVILTLVPTGLERGGQDWA
jgi:hypothetical protein